MIQCVAKSTAKVASHRTVIRVLNEVKEAVHPTSDAACTAAEGLQAVCSAAAFSYS
jgi:hypothetical protein